MNWYEFKDSLELPDFVDFILEIKETKEKKIATISVEFLIKRTKDLMIRGGDFYALRDPNTNFWLKDEQAVVDRIDGALYKARDYVSAFADKVTIKLMTNASTGTMKKFHEYVKQHMRDRYHKLDQKLIFQNQDVKVTDYVSKRLPYPIMKGPTDAYDELMNTLYFPDERQKIEWVYGAIIAGRSMYTQKFMVLYGEPGTGKGTVIEIGEELFTGFWGTWDSKDIGSGGAFAYETFKDDPIVCFESDGDLSQIKDNTRLNALVSNETVTVNAKYTKKYSTRFDTFLIMGTNNPVKIDNSRSGLTRRLIDVHPTGTKIPPRKYDQLMKQIKCELGAIAWHCKHVFEELGEKYYAHYIPTEMLAETNDFYDFVMYKYDEFLSRDSITQAEAWTMYQDYCDYSGAYKMKLQTMKIELRSYFREFYERKMIDGKMYYGLYSGFIADKFVSKKGEALTIVGGESESWLKFMDIPSLFDAEFADSKAQYAKDDGSPARKWENVTTTLSELDTHKLHWVKPSNPQLVIIDFDIKDENGNKDPEANLKAASAWPKTYAERSKSEAGIHLTYYYDGDIDTLSRQIDANIELKVFTGNASLRRKLTMCNDIPIAHISSGLPLKEVKKVVNWESAKTDRELKRRIVKALKKEYPNIAPSTACNIDFIKKLLDDAYESGITYQIDDFLKHRIFVFAINSTNQSKHCLDQYTKMHFVSKDIEENAYLDGVKTEEDSKEKFDDDRLVIFDCEVYPNFFGIVWKFLDSASCVRMERPTPEEVAKVLQFKLVGFNCRKYDNHILYARAVHGYSDKALFDLSQMMINEHKGFFSAAYDASYTDVYDFCTEKMSLKKWEIKLGISHQEMSLPWDQPIPEDRIGDLMDYCENDVLATEAVFKARQGDFAARKIQVELVKILHGSDIKVTVNDTTNTLSKRIIFGRNTKPQSEFNYRYLKLPIGSDRYEEYRKKFGDDYKFRVFNNEGMPMYRDYIPGEVLPPGWSILPFFPEYDFGFSYKSGYYDKEVTDRVGLGKSMYLGDIIGEGGRVHSKKGLWLNVLDLDISSQHPNSGKGEVLFGPEKTKIFSEIIDARIAVKHRDYEKAVSLLGGALKPFLTDELAGDLAQALKIVINSIYGLTSAKFENEFRDQRNEDNIVAKRGALFMSLLKREVERQGYTVCHIKTDSIKIPEADDHIKDFCIKFAKEYGYDFEVEGVFSKFCLLNDAAYIAKEGDKWITKATQFNKDSSPYVYKTLFSHEPIEFKDYCQTFSVSKGALYLDMNEDLEPVDMYEKDLEKLVKKLKKEGHDEEYIAGLDEVKSYKELISEGHNYQFIGRVSSFCPVKEGVGGGVLYRFDNGKYYAASGTTGYRWLESEWVKAHGGKELIDMNFFKTLVDEAVTDISKVCNDSGYDFEWFIS